jgi:hypothetical protein
VIPEKPSLLPEINCKNTTSFILASKFFKIDSKYFYQQITLPKYEKMVSVPWAPKKLNFSITFTKKFETVSGLADLIQKGIILFNTSLLCLIAIYTVHRKKNKDDFRMNMLGCAEI